MLAILATAGLALRNSALVFVKPHAATDACEAFVRDHPTFEVSADNVCVVCFDSKVDCVLLECGHAVVCLACSGGLKGECPMCRRPITRIVKLFYS